MKISFEEFEEIVMKELLSGDDHNLEILRAQFSSAEVRSREFTGVGFYTYFRPDVNMPKVEGKQAFQFGDLKVDLQGVKAGVGFVLFIKNGYLDFLEGYTYDDPWPGDIDILSIGFETNGIRDLEKLSKIWSL